MREKRIESVNGGITLATTIYERNDPIDCGSLPIPKLVSELEYLGVKTLGEFIDNYDDIMGRILGRYPDFFLDTDFTETDVRETLKFVE